MILVKYRADPSFFTFLLLRNGVEAPLRGVRGVPVRGVASQEGGSELKSAKVESSVLAFGFVYS